ncbi:MAG: hypothetical protein Kow0075_02750 [Salibacteraceae bacterium]
MRQILILPLLAWYSVAAQKTADEGPSLGVSAYADTYYSWYSKVTATALQQHDAIGAFHNNFGINIAQVSAHYNGHFLRGVATVHFGDIPLITWAPNYRNIQEANIGVKLTDGVWFDIGAFKTHVGTESFLPKENLMSILTLATYYGPFYQSGARLSIDKHRWHLELHAINGYNLHIDNNPYKTFGVLAQRQIGSRWLVSYSNMLGQERVGQLDDGYLIYQNAYTTYTYERWQWQMGFDLAYADQWKTNQGWIGPLYTGLVTGKYRVANRWSLSARAEVFSDEHSINSFRMSPARFGQVSYVASTVGMTVYGLTVGVEYKPEADNGFVRIESRTLYDPDATTSLYPSWFDQTTAGKVPMLNSRTQILFTAAMYFDWIVKTAKGQ